VSRLTVRTTTADDAPALAELANAESATLHGEQEASVEHVAHWFDLPDLSFWGAELDGRLVGYLDVRHERETNRFESDLRVHPDAWGEGVPDLLLETAEGWAGTQGEEGPVVQVFTGERNAEVRTALERRGYSTVRHFFRMEIDLRKAGNGPVWPEGITERAFGRQGDEQRLYEADIEAFAEHWGFVPVSFEKFSQLLTGPEDDPSLWKLAEDGGELAGFAVNAWHSSGDRSFGWVRILGVRPRWRRRGLGEALLRSSFAELAGRGATRAGLGVDAENTTGAVALYERAGMFVARRDDVYERTL
jgi:mycothiol synthase